MFDQMSRGENKVDIKYNSLLLVSLTTDLISLGWFYTDLDIPDALLQSSRYFHKDGSSYIAHFEINLPK